MKQRRLRAITCNIWKKDNIILIFGFTNIIFADNAYQSNAWNKSIKKSGPKFLIYAWIYVQGVPKKYLMVFVKVLMVFSKTVLTGTPRF